MSPQPAAKFSSAQLDAAIDVEAFQWAQFFDVTDPDQIEGRKRVMCANVAVGFFEPLLPYLSQRVGGIA